MKRLILVLFITVILSISLFAEDYYCADEPYTYFIYNEAGLTQAQLAEVMKLKAEYQSRFH